MLAQLDSFSSHSEEEHGGKWNIMECDMVGMLPVGVLGQCFVV